MNFSSLDVHAPVPPLPHPPYVCPASAPPPPTSPQASSVAHALPPPQAVHTSHYFHPEVTSDSPAHFGKLSRPLVPTAAFDALVSTQPTRRPHHLDERTYPIHLHGMRTYSHGEMHTPAVLWEYNSRFLLARNVQTSWFRAQNPSCQAALSTSRRRVVSLRSGLRPELSRGSV